MNPRILITREEDRADRWAELLITEGMEIVALPMTRYELLNPQPKRLQWDQYSWIAFTSSKAVHLFFEWCKLNRYQVPDDMPLAAISKSTAKEIEAHGYTVSLTGAKKTGKELAFQLVREMDNDRSKKVLFPAGVKTLGEFEAVLSQRRVRVEKLCLYRNEPRPATEIREEWANIGVYDVVVFAAPSAVEVWAEVVDEPWCKPCVAIGITTGRALETAGCYAPVVCEDIDSAALLKATTLALDMVWEERSSSNQ